MQSISFYGYEAADIEMMFARSAVEIGNRLFSRGAFELSLLHDSEIIGVITDTAFPQKLVVGPTAFRTLDEMTEIPCTCPLKRGCGHVVAVLLTLVHYLDPLGTLHKKEFLLDFPRIADDQIEVFFDELSFALSQPGQGGTKPQSKPEGDRIEYMIGLHQGGVFLEAFCRKTSGIIKPAEWNQIARARTGITADDRIIASFMSRSRRTGSAFSEDAEEVDRIMSALIASSRAYWHKAVGQPLRPGGVRQARIDWKVDQEGNQQLALVCQPGETVVLPLARPWYIDLNSGDCGKTQLDLPPPVVQMVQTAPLVKPDRAADVAKRIRSTAQLTSIPMPRTDIRIRDNTERLVPTLRLVREPSPYANTKSPASYVLELSFRYGETAITSLSADTEARQFDGATVHVMRRDIPSEKLAISRVLQCGFVQRYTNSAKPGIMIFSLQRPTEARWKEFLQQHIPLLKSEGWTVQIEPEFPFLTFEIAAEDWDGRLEEDPTRNGWFSLELGIVVEGEKFPLMPILQNALNDAELMKRTERSNGEFFYARMIDGRVIALDYNRTRIIIDTLMECFNKGASIGQIPRERALLVGQLLLQQQWLRTKESVDALRSIADPFARMHEIVVPSSLCAELRPYQQEGLAWLQWLRERSLSGILADDMGLGKTVQAIAHIVVEIEENRAMEPVLVVCPTSVVPNWRRELHRFAPHLKVLVFHGPARHAILDQIEQADVVITTYPLIAHDGQRLADFRWYLIVLDEAQAVKNAETISAQMLRTFETQHRVCLTGTPIQNHLGELWSQFDFLMPGYLGDKGHFQMRFRTPIERFGDKQKQELLGTLVKPFILRRTKDLVAKDLPSKTETQFEIDLLGDQLDLYESVRVSMLQNIRREIAEKGLAKCQILVFEALLRLRQICCDPRLCKIEAAKGVGESAKLAQLMDMLPALIDDGRKVLLFSQFTSMLELIKVELRKEQMPFVELTGSTTDRQTPVERFQKGEVPLFLLSLKAGGTGLNLTAADTVIHYDPWWNPAVTDQATDRAHRIGQDKPVFVYHLMTTNTVETKMQELQERKRKLADIVNASAHDLPTSLTVEDIESLFS